MARDSAVDHCDRSCDKEKVLCSTCRVSHAASTPGALANWSARTTSRAPPMLSLRIVRTTKWVRETLERVGLFDLLSRTTAEFSLESRLRSSQFIQDR
jgi:hypothetical protein